MLKKILCCFLAVLMLMPAIAMTSCGNEETPTEAPTQAPTEAPTEEPTEAPTEEPTEAPTEEPTEAPTEEPTEAPTEELTEAPTEEPTEAPTEEPTEAPTEEPTEAPTEEPTEAPTEEPTEAPTEEPTEAPTEEPTEAPTEEPTEAPTEEPTEAPTEEPEDDPSVLAVPEYVDAGINGKIKVTNSFNLMGLCDGLTYILCDKTQYKTTSPVTFKEGVILVDAETVADMFGFTYSATATTATLTAKGVTLVFTVDAATANVNGTEVAFPKAVSENGDILVSVDFIARWLGCTLKTVDGKAYIASSKTNMTEANIQAMDELYVKYRDIVYNYDDIEIEQTGVGIYEMTAYEDRLVGIAYSTWHYNQNKWNGGTWSTPLNGTYLSNDEEVIYNHGIMLRDAGVDFVFVDWTNNTLYDPSTMSGQRLDFRMIEEATDLLFEIWSQIEGAPKICIFAGPGHDGPASIGSHKNKVEQIYYDYVEQYPDMYFMYEGKPLLMCYGATPHLYGLEPSWTDDRFTVRWLTGFVGEQPTLYDATTRETYGFWSWEDRGLQTFTVYNNKVECVTVCAATRESINPYIAAAGREDGLTLKRQFQRANDLGSGMVIIVSWNEWWTEEQPSVEVSKDIEPSVAYGTYYYDLLCEQIKKYKGLVK